MREFSLRLLFLSLSVNFPLSPSRQNTERWPQGRSRTCLRNAAAHWKKKKSDEEGTARENINQSIHTAAPVELADSS